MNFLQCGCGRPSQGSSEFEKDVRRVPYPQRRSLGRRGVPSHLRKHVWTDLLCLNEAMEVLGGEDYYKSLLNVALSRSTAAVIEADVTRTCVARKSEAEATESLSQRPVELSEVQLMNVLWAFAAHAKDIGYCQSLNFVASLLFTVFESEVETFYALVQVVGPRTKIEGRFRDFKVGLDIAGYYKPDMKMMLCHVYVLTRLLRSKIPKASSFLAKRNIELSYMVTEWLHGLFTTILPRQSVLRVWDLMLVEGSKILIRVSLALIGYVVSELRDSSFEDFMLRFKKVLREKPMAPQKLVDEACSISLSRVEIDFLEEDYEKQPVKERPSSVKADASVMFDIGETTVYTSRGLTMVREGNEAKTSDDGKSPAARAGVSGNLVEGPFLSIIPQEEPAPHSRPVDRTEESSDSESDKSGVISNGIANVAAEITTGLILSLMKP